MTHANSALNIALFEAAARLKARAARLDAYAAQALVGLLAYDARKPSKELLEQAWGFAMEMESRRLSYVAPRVKCEMCDGSGQENDVITCDPCEGRGWIIDMEVARQL